MEKLKKYAVLGVLFILPITAYLFFASGVNHFAKLPVLTKAIAEPIGFKTVEGISVSFEGHLTVLGFFGNDLEANKAFAYNLAHQIYIKNRTFQDFQFLILLPEDAKQQAQNILTKISQIAPIDRWHFAFGSIPEIQRVFLTLKSPYNLDENSASPFVFLIDKEGNLRGRKVDNDSNNGKLYGYNSAQVAEINEKMNDDLKALLAEYRLALKKNNKYNTER